MGNRIKGITVRIGGDTTGLDKALAGTNSNIRNTQAQLKDVNRLLKLDPKNTELLAQKQKLLSQEVGETKEKLGKLKEAEKQVQIQMKEGKASQEQYEALQREIAETSNQLKSLKKEASTAQQAFANVQAGAKNVADKTRGMSVAASGALVGIAGMAAKSAAAADDINTLAKQTGLSTDQIQKYKYAADLIDVPLETITKSHAKLTKSMLTASKGTGDAANSFKELGVSIQNADGSLRNNKDVFNETIDALAGIENETQRDAYAMTIFGKSAQDLNPLILGGSEALEQLGTDAENAGLILSEDTLNSANKFNDSIDLLKAKTAGSFAKIGAEIATALTPILEKVAAVLEKVTTWFSNLSTPMQIAIMVVLGLVAAISPIAGIISAISGAMAVMNAAAAASPVTWTIMGIVAAVATLVAIGVALWKNWDTVSAKAKALWQSIKDAFNNMKNSANQAIAPIKDWLNQMIGKIKSAIDWFKNLFSWKKKNEGGGKFTGRANGGPVDIGSKSVVGERGPEILTVTPMGAYVQPLTATNNTTFHNSFAFNGFKGNEAEITIAKINEELGRIL